MRKLTEEEKNKFIIAYDTLCDGEVCLMDGEEGDDDYFPSLYDSEDEAFREIFDDNSSMLNSHKIAKQLSECNPGVTRKMVDEMDVINLSGDVAAMRAFMKKYPQCDDSGHSVMLASDFIMNKRLIFGEDGFVITGTKI